ncbi:hypothetical protein OBBRIDRAFT_808908 [Obba rivulosa]|uniref:Uncharacterized protein n=1 Tax=Obba rivulosa TaxID=1052685 RepID=A0A8E2AJP7_9APHY|nr:hypothetical protein OBBRIDRAFT_808908 [Obba rivulosa]
MRAVGGSRSCNLVSGAEPSSGPFQPGRETGRDILPSPDLAISTIAQLPRAARPLNTSKRKYPSTSPPSSAVPSSSPARHDRRKQLSYFSASTSSTASAPPVTNEHVPLTMPPSAGSSTNTLNTGTEEDVEQRPKGQPYPDRMDGAVVDITGSDAYATSLLVSLPVSLPASTEDSDRKIM